LDKEGKERIILFISGTFSGASLVWPINEKEMYAIVATFAKIKYLIGTINVIIKTDHANLSYMSQPSKSEKVERWKLNLSKFAHTFQVVAGSDNVVADGMSRLMGISILKSSTLMTIRNAQAAVLRDFHSGIAGHRGFEVTLKRLQSCGHQWETMESELRALIDSCPICQVIKPGGRKRGVAQTFELNATEEMETVAMDTLGPLDEDSQGYCYILGLTDEFSRYTELTATKSTTAAEAAQVMLNYCCTYGIPQSWKSDRGSQFNNQVLTELNKSLLSTPKLTSVGSSQENGIVERKFRDVRADLGALMREDPTSDWSDKIKIVQRIINSTPSSSTSIAPADLRFGKAQSLDVNLLIKAPSKAKPDGSVLEMQNSQVTRLRATYDQLASTISKHLDRHGAAKDKKRRSNPTQYPVGSWVFWELPETRKGDPSSTRRTGPYQVISQSGNAVKVYWNEKEKIIPVSACTAFVPGQVAPERLQAENSESAETRYFVSEIIDHCFDVPSAPKLGNCKLLVKWAGYPAPTWHYVLEVPDIRMTEALVQYVKTHPSLAWLVSKKVRPS
jgi:transposase InsO family protein